MTKTEQFEEKQKAMSDADLLKGVRNEVHKFCKTGGRSIIMHVPPMITDTDMIICELARRYEELLKENINGDD